MKSYLTIGVITFWIINTISIQTHSWYRLYSNIPDPSRSLEIKGMNSNELLTTENITSSLAGYDSHFIPRNISTITLSRQGELDRILCKSTQEENREIYRIKMYYEITKTLNTLTSSSVCEKDKLDLIRISEFLTNISGNYMTPNIESGNLLSDWEWDIDEL